MKIVLLGYMASGKSLIGKTLAQVLGYSFIDLDDYIEQDEKQTIQEIFKNKGEIYFRKKEHLALNEILLHDKNIVLSLGGGTPCYSNNMDMLSKRNDVTSIYLKTSIPEIINRLTNEQDKRPVVSHLKSKEELTEFIGKHLFERSTFYNQANYKVDANKDEMSIVESILLQLF